MPQTLTTESAVPVTAERFKRFYTPKEAAEYLGVGHSTLSIHRMNGTGPKWIKWGVNVRYDVQALDEWMAAHTVTPAPRAETTKRRVGRPRKTEGK
ncbi:MAG: helix-turn-helix domain-containing protein [Candidatus Hydrogenedentes bacterium]|nr:helix-turn-helix domain-containing protein [Candidatus Hydrogenedentota bacterium]